MFAGLQARTAAPARAWPRWIAGLAAGSTLLLAACTGSNSPSEFLSRLPGPSQPAGPPQASTNIGAGQVKVGLILPLSAGGNAGVAALSMRNAAEMALAEFNNPDLQLLVKDDSGNAFGAQQAAQQALDEGAELILGPLFAQSVGPVGQLARSKGVPVVAFSTDANVASRGIYLLSFLPESDVDRIVGYAAGQGKKSFAAAIPDNAYGTVVEAAFKQIVPRRGGRVVAL
jgi:branched-chain amino acid transport system substrate-binding protein